MAGRKQKKSSNVVLKKASAVRSAAVHTAAAQGHADRGDFEAALSSFSRAIELDPGSAEALCGRSGIHGLPQFQR